MPFSPIASARICRVRLVLALAAMGVLSGCAAASEASPPPISAASELAVADLTPSVITAELDPDVAAATTTTQAPPTTLAVTTVPATTVVTIEEPVTDPREVEALDRIGFPWRQTLPGWSIVFRPERVGLRGLTKSDDRQIEIYVRDSDTSDSLLRIIAHELGHAVDITLNSPADRERWRVARGVGPNVPWWPGNAMADFDTLAGDFAEAFATLLTGSVSLSRVAPAPGPAELAILAEKVGRTTQGDPGAADRRG